jgi:tetratricopeptide (TPR) repeat protein
MLMSPRSMTREPRSPPIFFGRDSELAQIIEMILANLRSSPAHIAILGPGGYGKTILANAVLTHASIQEHFGDSRYLVACESVFSPDALLIELAKTLGVFDGATDAVWSRIHTTLNSKDCILCFDNFESPWDQDGDIRCSVEELLSSVAKTERTTLLITMRGIVRPAQTRWTMPLLAPLTTLDHDSARRVWEHTTETYDEFAEELIKAVDSVPLAVSLLAHLAQATSPEILLRQWNSKQTGFIHMGQPNRQLSLDHSIQLSIDSSRMRANPSAKELLGVLSMLPDGMHTRQIGKFITVLPIDILSGISTLQECGLITVIGERYQTHPIIRNFCNNSISISQEHKFALTEFYISLACARYGNVKANQYSEMVLEVNNTKAILSDLLRSDLKSNAKLVEAICEFIGFQSSIGDFSDKLIYQTVKSLRLVKASETLVIKCLIEWGKLQYGANKLEKAKDILKSAESLCRGSRAGKEYRSSQHANIFYMLGKIYLLEKAFDKAETSIQKALELHKFANDISGQADDYNGLGETYLYSDKPNKAKVSYQKALELNKSSNSIFKQGADYNGLGNTYLDLKQLNEAEASYQKALTIFKNSNSALGQGNALQGLGRVYMKQSQMQKAKTSFENAFAMHGQAQNALGQRWDQHYLDRCST